MGSILSSLSGVYQKLVEATGKWSIGICFVLPPPPSNTSPFILCLIPTLSDLQVQIVYKPVDLSKVTSKCGSLGNIHHKPGSP